MGVPDWTRWNKGRDRVQGIEGDEDGEGEEDNEDDEEPIPAPRPSGRPRPTRKIVAAEDTEMSDVLGAGSASQASRPASSVPEEEPPATIGGPSATGLKRALQVSPNRAELTTKRARTTRQVKVNVPGLDLGDMEVTEDDRVDLDLIPKLGGKVRGRRYRRWPKVLMLLLRCVWAAPR